MLRFGYLPINVYLILQIISERLFLMGIFGRKGPYLEGAPGMRSGCGSV